MINLFWHCRDINNFGDVLPNYVLNRLGVLNKWSNTDDEPLYMLSGSCMQDVKTNVICGCLGFGSADQKIDLPPELITSVRGKITRDMLISQGIDCPEMYFDYAYLLPTFFDRDDLGKRLYVPHYVDIETNIDGFEKVDICSGVENVMSHLMKASSVITSSLHIMMVCEIFNIKYEFANTFNKIAGDGMKYYDYLSTINKPFKPINL